MTRLRIIDEQRELVESFTRPVDTLLNLARLREGRSPDGGNWSQLAELGWLGISLGEDQGGIGLGPVEEALTAETLGRHLISPCFLATVIAARVAEAEGLSELAQRFAAGSSRAALGISLPSSQDEYAIDADGCEFVLLVASDSIRLSEIQSLAVHDDVHWSLPVYAIVLGRTLAMTGDESLLAFSRLLGAATLAGIASQSCDSGVEYAKVREQFGQPIGAFQAGKHHCANMAISAYGSRELVYRAAMALEEKDAEAPALAAAALNFAARAARGNAGTCVQVHGGIGFSAEADPHHFVKRAHLMEAAFGGLGAIRSMLAERS